MLKALSTAVFLFIAKLLMAQGFTKWVTGDTADFVTNTYQPGIVLAGGGGDNDNAMKWMLQRAGGGDVLILRASGSDGYNDYFYQDLGVTVNSVETIRFDAAAAATNPYIIQQLENAELLFLAGGDQHDYYQYWKGTPIADAINSLINEKGITVGGTSAGMAILGGAYYAPPGSSLVSEEALANPFHPNAEVLGNGDFIHAPRLENLITDTHYDDRDRQGRHMTFLARIAHDHGVRSYGIAANEYVAVCMDGAGIARVFGEYPAYQEFAYFLKSNCQPDYAPETIESGTPLTWNRQQSAVKVYKMPGILSGNNSFDLNDWMTASGGEWQNWYVEGGEMLKVFEVDGDCASVVSTTQEDKARPSVKVFPNPFDLEVFIEIFEKNSNGQTARLCNLLGQTVWSGVLDQDVNALDLGYLPPGSYWLVLLDGKGAMPLKLMKNSSSFSS